MDPLQIESSQHIFHIVGSPNTKYPLEVTVDFKPVKFVRYGATEGSTSINEQYFPITPKYNRDDKFYTPSFVQQALAKPD